MSPIVSLPAGLLTPPEVPESPFSSQNVCFGADAAVGFRGMEVLTGRSGRGRRGRGGG